MYRLYKYHYRYPRVDLRCYCVILGYDGDSLKILLIERQIDPFRGNWELPGGFLRLAEGNDDRQSDSCVEDCAARVIARETTLQKQELHLLGVFLEEQRDLLDKCMPVVYWTLVDMNQLPQSRLYTDIQREVWFNIDNLPDIAFNHHGFIQKALSCLQERVQNYPMGRGFVREKFTLSELKAFYEAILLRPLDEQVFRRKITSLGHVEDIKERGINIFKRPARLFRFNHEIYDRLQKEGLKRSF